MPAAGSIRDPRTLLDLGQPVVDAACVVGALLAVKYAGHQWIDEPTWITGLLGALAFFVAAQMTGLQRRWHGSGPDGELMLVVGTWMLAALALAMAAFLTRYGDHFGRLEIVAWMIAAPTLIGLMRMHSRMLQAVLMRRGVGVRRVAVAGLNPLGLQVTRSLHGDPGKGLRVVGFYDDRDGGRRARRPADSPVWCGKLADLVAAAQAGEVDMVLVTLPMRAEKRIRDLLDSLSDSTASVYIVPDFFVFELLHSRWTNVGGLPAVSIFENPLYGVDGALKRATDVVLALAALVVAVLPMMMIAAAVKFSSPGPVFFRQRRYGLDGREIRVWKFRSMRVCDDGPMVRQATAGDARVTAVGALLRRTSLDELPQLFNVLGGSMSLVGPRPHANAHNEQYRRLIRGYMLRHKTKPGITGLAQVSGCRGETDTLDKMQRRVELDHQYIRQWSLWLDLKILAKTLVVAWHQPEAY